MIPMNVEILDSRDDARMTYVIVDKCKVKVLKTKLKNYCYLLKVVGNECHISLDLDDCEKEPIK